MDEQPIRGLKPWQFFLLAALGCAAAVIVAVRQQSLVVLGLLGTLMATTALVGIATLRTLRPLVSAEEDLPTVVGHRTRAALEREKTLALRAIKELEFDRAMGKLSEADWHEMSGRLRARAARLMRDLDAGSGYREQIEKDLAKRLAQPVEVARKGARARAGSARACAACATINETDARFCKGCGAKL